MASNAPSMDMRDISSPLASKKLEAECESQAFSFKGEGGAIGGDSAANSNVIGGATDLSARKHVERAVVEEARNIPVYVMPPAANTPNLVRTLSGANATMLHSGYTGIGLATSGGSSYSTTKRSVGPAMMTGATFTSGTSYPQSYGGSQRYTTGYSTAAQSNIVSSSRGQETLQSERIMSSNVVNESFMGPLPAEEDVQYIETPVIEEVIKTVPRREIIEVEKIVPRREIEWVERVVEVPQIQYVDREVEVPQVHEVVRQVPVRQVIEVPRETVKTVPKIEIKVVEREIEVPGEIIEVPKPYVVENKVIVPRFTNIDVPVVVAQRLVPRISESTQDHVDVELSEYVPKLVTVDVYVPKPVQRQLIATGRVDEHRVVDIPVAHMNGLLKLLNVNLPEEEMRNIFIKESSGAVSVAPISGPLISPLSEEWQSGHTAGTLHYTTSSSGGTYSTTTTTTTTTGNVASGGGATTTQQGGFTTTQQGGYTTTSGGSYGMYGAAGLAAGLTAGYGATSSIGGGYGTSMMSAGATPYGGAMQTTGATMQQKTSTKQTTTVSGSTSAATPATTFQQQQQQQQQKYGGGVISSTSRSVQGASAASTSVSGGAYQTSGQIFPVQYGGVSQRNAGYTTTGTGSITPLMTGANPLSSYNLGGNYHLGLPHGSSVGSVAYSFGAPSRG